jgi:hypothetical protein
MTSESAVAFMTEAARYFGNRDTGGEDSAFWSNVANQKNCEDIAALISSLVAERDAALDHDWVARPAFETAISEAYDFRTRALTAERLLAEARAEQPDMETFVRWLRAWTKARHGVWITHNTAKGAYNEYVATLSTGGVNG